MLFASIPATAIAMSDSPDTLFSAAQVEVGSDKSFIDLLWIMVAAFLVFIGIQLFYGLRVNPEEELNGLDPNEHGMTAYPDSWA